VSFVSPWLMFALARSSRSAAAEGLECRGCASHIGDLLDPGTVTVSVGSLIFSSVLSIYYIIKFIIIF
jgi:hypothetical protein